MTDGALARLRARASRRDYVPMTQLAKALYDRGLHAPDVLRECYGAEFPAEFFVVAGEPRRSPALLARFTNLPWQLVVAPGEETLPVTTSAPTQTLEQRMFVRDPDLVPLMRLVGAPTTGDRPVYCYRLTELREGRSAVFGIKATATARDPVTRYGDSLLDVLHTHHKDVLGHMEWVVDQPWNRGFGAEDERAVEGVRALVERIEELRRRVD